MKKIIGYSILACVLIGLVTAMSLTFGLWESILVCIGAALLTSLIIFAIQLIIDD